MSSSSPNRRDAEEAPVADVKPVQPGPALTQRDIKLIMMSLVPAMFLSALDQTIVATALPTIGADFNNVADLSWVVSAYLLASTAAAPVFGTLSDIYGRRTMLVISIGLFLTGSLLCALAPSLLWLILARAMQGLGGGGIFPIAQSAVSDMITPRERAKLQSYFSAVWVSAGIGGPVLGGFFAQHLHWSMIFWINLPIGLFSLGMLIRYMRNLPKNSRPRRVDIFGGFLLMAAAVTIMLVLTWGGHAYAWFSPTILSMAGAAVMIAVTYVWHARRTKEPFIPISIVTGPVLPYAFVMGSLGLATSIGLAVHMPLYFQGVYALDASQAGLALIPVVVGTVPGALVAGQAITHLKRYKWPTVAGTALASLTMAIMAIATPLPLLVLVPMLCIIGIGIGTAFPLSTVVTQNAVAKDKVGTATGSLNFSRALTSSFVVAVFSAILLGSLGHHVNLESADLAHAVAPDALVAAYRWMFATGAVLLAISVVALLMMEERPFPHRRETTDVIAE